MKYFNTLVFSGLLLTGVVGGKNAEAFCSQPSMYDTAPSPPYSLSKPSAPFCLSGYSYTRKHSCDEWEIQNYIDDINEYIRKLNNFADEARAFANASITFSNDAVRYAKCEADNVKSEIE